MKSVILSLMAGNEQGPRPPTVLIPKKVAFLFDLKTEQPQKSLITDNVGRKQLTPPILACLIQNKSVFNGFLMTIIFGLNKSFFQNIKFHVSKNARIGTLVIRSNSLTEPDVTNRKIWCLGIRRNHNFKNTQNV